VRVSYAGCAAVLLASQGDAAQSRGGIALGWEEQGPLLMMVVVLMDMLENVAKGVRHRWPAFVAALAVGWGVDRLAHAGVPASDSLWGTYVVYALWTLTALATFVAVTRLPRSSA
jgi:hypothetical protein